MTVKRDGRGRLRDYAKEYREYHGTAEQRKNRSMRNQARAKAGCGKGMEADHKKPLSKGGSNAKSNIRCTTRAANRRKADK